MQINSMEIDNAAKNIFKACLLEDEVLQAKYNQFIADERLEEFVKILNTAVESVWNGTEHEDEVEKEKYRTLAKAALKAFGFQVQFNNQMHLQVLV